MLRGIWNRLRGPCRKIQAGDAYWLAWGDGHHDDSAALRHAVQSVHSSGGGQVHIPAGKFKIGDGS